ncbi:MAG: hypothetical protein HWD61_05620 [Parachlamydiaceae bacterium]|nr:MAG: hypothetical protein HWD61_05620 [Parachlamydiaceae bacterium]
MASIENIKEILVPAETWNQLAAAFESVEAAQLIQVVLLRQIQIQGASLSIYQLSTGRGIF